MDHAIDHTMPGWMPVCALRRIGGRIVTSEYANSLRGTIGTFRRQVPHIGQLAAGGDAALALGALCPRGAARGGAARAVDVGEEVMV